MLQKANIAPDINLKIEQTNITFFLPSLSAWDERQKHMIRLPISDIVIRIPSY